MVANSENNDHMKSGKLRGQGKTRSKLNW